MVKIIAMTIPAKIGNLGDGLLKIVPTSLAKEDDKKPPVPRHAVKIPAANVTLSCGNISSKF